MSSHGVGYSALPAANVREHPATTSNTISNVVIVTQTNRSFDNLFATFPGANGATVGKMPGGQTVPLKSSNLYSPKLYQNSRAAFQVDYDQGQMDGFSAVYVDQKACRTCAYE